MSLMSGEEKVSLWFGLKLINKTDKLGQIYIIF